MKTFASWQELVRHIIEERRVTEYQIGKECGIEPPIIYKITGGHTLKPSRFTIRRLEDGLRIKINDKDPNALSYKPLAEGEDATKPEELDVETLSDIFMQQIRVQVGKRVSETKLQKVKTIIREVLDATFND
ncbi:MAG: hypothetical protein M1378_11345 [Bacteroidetes bacterium]|nr:hypothetical protein [Bacteroidota bacterium]